MTIPIPVYDASSPSDISLAIKAVSDALAAVPPVVQPELSPGTAEPEEGIEGEGVPDFDIPENSQLIGIPSEVYAQIRAALKSGKRHLMFYGPPGTGKTSLAEYTAGVMHTSSVTVTGSADWSSQDVIGGYQPMPNGGLRFVKGVLLENFDKPVIIDELNRCDIDRVLGPLFTVLSGQPTTLPYFFDAEDEASPRLVILPDHKANKLDHEFSPTQNWRLLATINSIDKASLYQLSYALTRRFAWIFVDVPPDLKAFVQEFCTMKGIVEGVDLAAPVPLATIWAAVNSVRPMGAAPFIDIVKFCRSSLEDFDFFTEASPELRKIYLSAFYVFVMPMLDGIAHEEAKRVAADVAGAVGLEGGDATALERRLLTIAL